MWPLHPALDPDCDDEQARENEHHQAAGQYAPGALGAGFLPGAFIQRFVLDEFAREEEPERVVDGADSALQFAMALVILYKEVALDVGDEDEYGGCDALGHAALEQSLKRRAVHDENDENRVHCHPGRRRDVFHSAPVHEFILVRGVSSGENQSFVGIHDAASFCVVLSLVNINPKRAGAASGRKITVEKNIAGAIINIL